VIQGK